MTVAEAKAKYEACASQVKEAGGVVTEAQDALDEAVTAHREIRVKQDTARLVYIAAMELSQA